MLPLTWISVKVFIWILCIQGSLSLRGVKIFGPDAVQIGEKFELKCIYDLEQEDLYAVKWYRGDQEFCRYNPRKVPPLRAFEISGFEVDIENSDAQKITIKAGPRTMGRRFTCEVTADAPSFQAMQDHAIVYFVDLPKYGPELNGLKARYRPGMKLQVECVSRNSMPPANLTFFVNNDRASHNHVWHRVEVVEPKKLMSAFSTIQFLLQKHHFVGGQIRIKCIANIYSIYHKTTIASSALAEKTRKTTANDLGSVVIPIRNDSDSSGENIQSRTYFGILQILNLIILKCIF